LRLTAVYDAPSGDGYPDPGHRRVNLRSAEYLKSLALPALGGDGHGVRDQSPLEQFARKVNKHGLPLAQLWENDTALVFLGLNRKGRPGLWFVHKTD
jgi:hypothetical protein